MKTCITYFGILLLGFSMNVRAQLYGNPIFTNNGNYKYFIGSSEPDSNWYEPGYNDSGWSIGDGSIGFGDGDDSIVIPKVTSVYLRIHFDVKDKNLVKESNLLADFDDGYAAYLNGVEIIRVNLGSPGDHILHDRTTNRSHEAVYYRNYDRPVTSYYIDKTILLNTLKDGENILAVQVHNDSVNGSDLSFNSTLFNYIPASYSVWNNPYRFYAQVPLDSSKFPIILINTDELGLSLKKVRFNARMSVIYNPDNEYNKPADPFTDYDNGLISIEIRGNSTADVPKNSYNIETQDINGDNLNVSLMGMPADDDWVLYAPFADKSLIRNELAFYLGRMLGYYEPRTRFCELIFNGEYRGLYVLTEKIKRNSNRVNVSQNSFTAESGVEVSGGYVLRFGDNDIYPRPDDRTEAQNAYLNNFLGETFSILNRHSLGDPNSGYRKYIDEQYLIDYMLANELMHNVDAYGSSTFLFKDRDDIDGKLKFGPIWDNDLSLGNTFYRNLPNEWMFDLNKENINFTRFLSDTVFANNLAKRWAELRLNVYSNQNLLHFIDSVSNVIKESRIMNYKVWPLLSAPLLWPSYIPATYEFEIDTMKQWLVMHAAWIDENINKLNYALPPVSIDQNEISIHDGGISIYPVPFMDYINICLNAGEEIEWVEIIDVAGRTVMQKRIDFVNTGLYQITGLNELQSGAYLISVQKSDGKRYNKMIIKR